MRGGKRGISFSARMTTWKTRQTTRQMIGLKIGGIKKV
jgi:hypothetical protein